MHLKLLKGGVKMIAEMIKESKERLNYMVSNPKDFNANDVNIVLVRLKNLKKLKWIDLIIYLPFYKRFDYLLKTPATLLKLACDTLGYSTDSRFYISALLQELPRPHYFNEDNLELAIEILDEASSVFSIYVEDGKIKFFD